MPAPESINLPVALIRFPTIALALGGLQSFIKSVALSICFPLVMDLCLCNQLPELQSQIL